MRRVCLVVSILAASGCPSPSVELPVPDGTGDSTGSTTGRSDETGGASFEDDSGWIAVAD